MTNFVVIGDVHSEGSRISGFCLDYNFFTLFLELFCVVTVFTLALWRALFVAGETFTVEFEAFGFGATAFLGNGFEFVCFFGFGFGEFGETNETWKILEVEKCKRGYGRYWG